ALPSTPAHALEPQLAGLADLSLEELSRVEVTTVSRRPERLSDAAASIYVITAEDIRRSGATTLPEALRLAPNLDVARADANQYAITTRGFSSVLENKLLVMIDGRTVYSPLFSGVLWEAEDVLLDDVERIEVLSGPGGTLWGTNAVNGVINVVTRPASREEGSMARGGLGTQVRTAAARHEGPLGESGAYRVYGKLIHQLATERADGTSLADASDHYQGGFRTDWEHGSHHVTLQGDGYHGDIDQGATLRKIGGMNLLGRWTRQKGDGPALQLQAYYDRTTRDQPGAIREELNAFEVELQHGWRPFAHHEFLWGGGYRYQPDRVENVGPALAFLPPNHRLAYTNVFVQDEVGILPRVTLSAGVKLEHNPFTRYEYLPSAKVAWKPTDVHLLWGSLSRVVRAPSRVDREFFSPAAPPHFIVAGGPDFVSEISEVAEVGWRAQPLTSVAYSVTAYYDDWDGLRSLEPTASGPVFANGIEGFTRGVEAWAEVRVHRFWRLAAGWVTQTVRLHVAPGFTGLGGVSALGNDPGHWWMARSSMDLGRTLALDAMVRQVGQRPNGAVPAYTAVDARLGWTPVKSLELSVSGRNLFDRRHPEWGIPVGRPEFEREGLAEIIWRP
ncbi:MAG TPA: TonB-dependent receptor, partial [Candidatus Polarisedimenticolia bacterium]|nr:TonB-dependent receptor [Candidatus Polarisedimenticolia bacterium]